MKHNSLTAFFLTCSLFIISPFTLAFDDEHDNSTVDKADRFDFQDFHKDSAVTLWGKDKDKKEDSKAINTYDEKPAQLKTETVDPAPVTTSTKTDQKKFDKGQELNVRSSYKLSVDPSLATIPTLFEAIQSLHQQLNGYCPNGWKKEEEWHLPEQNYFYIHYRAKCL